jgi:putative PIN family toxin of toxin-antitoxin system
MPKQKKIKAIIDTNLFISFLIGKKLKSLKQRLNDASVELIFAEQNILEIKIVTSRKKFRKYFDQNQVDDLIHFIQTTGRVYQINEVPKVCRDPKDDFLLELAKISNADFLVTGDKDLIDMRSIGETAIITVEILEDILNEVSG